MDEQMLLKFLTNARSPMTAQEITRFWQPTWTQEQVESMLARLLALQKVCAEGLPTVRYRSTACGAGGLPGTVPRPALRAQQGEVHHGVY